MVPIRRNVIRRAVAIAIAAAFAKSALAETVGDTILAMGRYLKAVGGLLYGASNRVDDFQVADLAAATKRALGSEIDALASTLGNLIGPKGIFVQDLRGYLLRARNQQFDSDEKRRDEWRRIQGEVEAIAEMADRVLAMVERPDSRLHFLIADEDRLKLADVMRERGIRLRRFPQIPPPVTPGDLNALEYLVEHHELLLRITKDFRQTLERKKHILLA